MKKCRNPRNVSDIWRNMVNCENGFIDMEVAFRINFYLSQNEVIGVKNSNHDLDDPNKDHNDLKDDHVSLSICETIFLHSSYVTIYIGLFPTGFLRD